MGGGDSLHPVCSWSHRPVLSSPKRHGHPSTQRPLPTLAQTALTESSRTKEQPAHLPPLLTRAPLCTPCAPLALIMPLCMPSTRPPHRLSSPCVSPMPCPPIQSLCACAPAPPAPPNPVPLHLRPAPPAPCLLCSLRACAPAPPAPAPPAAAPPAPPNPVRVCMRLWPLPHPLQSLCACAP